MPDKPRTAPAADQNVGDHVPVDVISSEEVWSTYNLADGSVVRVKPVIAEIIRVVGTFTPEGEPLYLLKGGMVPSVRVPKNLLRKP